MRHQILFCDAFLFLQISMLKDSKSANSPRYECEIEYISNFVC